MRDAAPISIIVGIVLASGWLGQRLAMQPPNVMFVLAALVVLCIIGGRRLK